MIAAADPSAEGSTISLPKGGGALAGLGEAFTADPFTGGGRLSIPIMLPPGRGALRPELNLAYSTGTGNGPFGLGWQLTVPSVSRKTANGIPRYRDGSDPNADGADTFLLPAVDDLVPLAGSYPGRVRYRPRSENLFARIEHVRDDTGDYWEVRSKDGLLTRYGTVRPAGADAGWRDPAATADPAEPGRVFAWGIAETQDLLGNLIRYEYSADRGEAPAHRWDRPQLARISYADYGDRQAPSFLVTVDLIYEPRPDPFSGSRAGFEVRTTQRCSAIRISTHAFDGVDRVSTEYRFGYVQAPLNGASLLAQVQLVGIDDQQSPAQEEPFPPVIFGYSAFDPAGRRFERLTGDGFPTTPLSDPALALVDLRGAGLPDIVELGPTTRRYWANAGDGRFELPRPLAEAPPFSLGDPGVRLLDADGDGRADLLVPTPGAPGDIASGYFPMSFAGGWSRRGFRPYQTVPAASVTDSGVRLVDLDGDGLTDVLRSGSRLQCWFNDVDPRRAWQRTASADGSAADVDLADPRVRLADMTGDGLQDIVLLRSGAVAYWPNLGHGRWGAMVTMRGSPRLPEDLDPRRLLLGDLDGDGAADLAYVDDGRVLLWGNETGNAWSAQPIAITGTPALTEADSIQLTDLLGTGMAGLLWTRPADGTAAGAARFLDFTGRQKPHLLQAVDNNLGALTRIDYRSSTAEHLRDVSAAATRWRTTLPFPVHVVSRVEVTDALSEATLTSEYRYHHGYWDGVEREFRGFGCVERLDAEVFGGPPDASGQDPRHAPPVLTRTWFHLGPVAAGDADEWIELDLSVEHWAGDPAALERPADVTAALNALPRRARRDALRTLRGTPLRSELYALDGDPRQDRPFTVTESVMGVREEPVEADGARGRVFSSFHLAARETEWTRGEEPMSEFAFTAPPDAYGFVTQRLAIAVPRGRDPRSTDASATEPYLATLATTEYARRDDDRYVVDRVARSSVFEVVNDGTQSVVDLSRAVLGGPAATTLALIGHKRTAYDGEAHVGLPIGRLGDTGAPVRVEALAFTDAFLDGPPGDAAVPAPYLTPDGAAAWTDEYPDDFRARVPVLLGYRHLSEADDAGSPAGYYIVTTSRAYDFHDAGRTPRGLCTASRDPLGAESRFTYDEHDLLLTNKVDAAGLVVGASYDARTLRPHAAVDVNGNSTAVTFSPAGLVTGVFRRGSDGEGDITTPGTRCEYDLFAFADRRQPVSVRSIRRVYHDTDQSVPDAERSAEVTTVEYSDGFARVLQTRTQAPDTLFGDPVLGSGDLPSAPGSPVGDCTGRTRGADDPPNVVVSGANVYDNKGRVVERYAPYFAAGWDWAAPADAERNYRTSLDYDARGHVVRTVNPDGSEQRVVRGVPVEIDAPDVYAPTPWESFVYDANDNGGRTHADGSASYSDHWNTPGSVEVDALGRGVRAVARLSRDPAGLCVTRSHYDVAGHLLAVDDPLGRRSFAYRLDLAGRRWSEESLDGGRRDTIRDALGNAVETRDAKGALVLRTYDVLHRPDRMWARDGATGRATLRELWAYGDAGDPAQAPDERQQASARNLLGRAVACHDDAGLLTIEAADLNGTTTERTRRLVADDLLLAPFADAASAGWSVDLFQMDWQPGPNETLPDREAALLDARVYRTSTRTEALGRVTSVELPEDADGSRRTLVRTYDPAGRVDGVRLDSDTFVERTAYSASGLRVLSAYGNGVMTRLAYDAQTARLARLHSERYAPTGDGAYHPIGDSLQDFAYDADLIGNIVAIHDRTPGSGIPANPQAFAVDDPALGHLLSSGNALERRFVYDPLYRLVSATGRECGAAPAGGPWSGAARCGDPTQTTSYTERYAFDAAGNLLTLSHATDAGGFQRSFVLQDTGNRLARMIVDGNPFDYAFDAAGNMTAETTSRHFDWDHADRLRAFRTQIEGAEPSVHVQYLHDAAGECVKKLVRRQGGQTEVTHSIDGCFDHHRWTGGEATETHVTDDVQRVAVVRSGPPRPGDASPAVAFVLGDHLGSSHVICDAGGAVFNREEFTPFGETSFGGYGRKRHRFAGRERDEESGLSHHGARWAALWLARWTSADPTGLQGGLNAYAFVSARPTSQVDPAGAEDHEAIAIANQLQDVANTADFRRLPGETDSAYGIRMHDVFKNMAHSTPPHFAEGRVVTEVVVNREGVVVAYGRGPTDATHYSRWNNDPNVFTADGVILKEGVTANDVVGKRLKDVALIGFDFKTGKARLSGRQREGFRRTGVPLAKLDKSGKFVDHVAYEVSGLSREEPHLGSRGLGGAGETAALHSSQMLELTLLSRSDPPPLDGEPPPRDYYGDESLLQIMQCTGDVATFNWRGIATCMVQCAASQLCHEVAKEALTGGMPATSFTLRGGFGGMLRSPADAYRELNHRSY